MISRKTTIAIAEAYARKFHIVRKHRSSRGAVTYRYSIDTDKLYDFLYSNDYPYPFCNLARSITGAGEQFVSGTRKLIDFVMGLHTGESLISATKNLDIDINEIEDVSLFLLYRLATDLLNHWLDDEEEGTEKVSSLSKSILSLQRRLELDGYKYSNGMLLRPDESVIVEEVKLTVLEALYITLGLDKSDVAKHHLDLSQEHYISQRWDDSISNSRKYIECVLREIARKHNHEFAVDKLADDYFSKAANVRDHLLKIGLIDEKEHKALIAVYGLLSNTGSHPHMAQKDQARLLRDLTLTLAQFAKLRFQGFIEKEKSENA